WRWGWWRGGGGGGGLVALDAGALPPAERTRVELHVATCAGCRDALRALREMPGVLAPGEPPGLDDEFWRDQRLAIMRTIRDLPAPARVRRWWHTPDPVSRRPWAASAVVAAATAMLAVAILRPGMPWRPP